MNDYLRARLLEWSTLRGLIWFLTGLCGISLSDADVIQIAHAIQAVFGASDVQGPLHEFGMLSAVAMSANGLVGMFSPDGLTSNGWNRVRRIFGMPLLEQQPLDKKAES